MSIREQIKNDILARSELAGKCIEKIKNTQEITEKEVVSCVHEYVCLKFFLSLDETAGLSLNEMAIMSIDRAYEIGLPVAKESERATTCGMAGSAPMKIALLLNAIRKDLDLQVDPHTLGLVKDTAELGKLIYDNL